MVAIGVLVPVNPGPLQPPMTRPVGRAALALRKEGITVIFGDRIERRGDEVWMTGQIAIPGAWQTVTQSVQAIHDRYPSQRRARSYAAAMDVAGNLPLGNPTSLTMLCRDKLDCQRWLASHGIPMPAVSSDPQEWPSLLTQWGSGFLKPRYGALGIGVQRVCPGDALPHTCQGVVPGKQDPTILQRAIAPPSGWAGLSVRALCQRKTDKSWTICPPVLRRSTTDFVVNAARGATVHPAEDVLSADSMKAMATLCQSTCAALSAHSDGDRLVEVGLDLVIDPQWDPHLIEVNSRPRGRLEVLASADPSRFHAAHIDACARPIRYLAHIAQAR